VRICYLPCHEAGLCCYLVICLENLLHTLQLIYFHLWPIYWLSFVHIQCCKNQKNSNYWRNGNSTYTIHDLQLLWQSTMNSSRATSESVSNTSETIFISSSGADMIWVQHLKFYLYNKVCTRLSQCILLGQQRAYSAIYKCNVWMWRHNSGDKTLFSENTSIFWDVTFCSPVKVNSHFGEHIACILGVEE
jgi:hypothetical protein